MDLGEQFLDPGGFDGLDVRYFDVHLLLGFLLLGGDTDDEGVLVCLEVVEVLLAGHELERLGPVVLVAIAH